jgi:hypothetical protein
MWMIVGWRQASGVRRQAKKIQKFYLNFGKVAAGIGRQSTGNSGIGRRATGVRLKSFRIFYLI